VDFGPTLQRAAVIAAIVALVGALAFWLQTRRRRDASLVAPYSEIKRRIRAGEAEGSSPKRTAPPVAAKSLDEAFALADDDDFLYALLDRMGIPDRDLTSGDATILAVFGLFTEVNNGGFDQYFFNSAADRAADVAASLRAIGASKTLAIFERAVTVFPDARPDPVRERRWKQMDAWTKEQKFLLGRLDLEFYDLDEKLTALLAAWARAHGDRFG
jgi:hypothetical protein